MTTQSLLISGVSGYCGGTILNAILNNKALSNQLRISGLVRNDEQRDFLVNLGLSPVMFKDWDETDLLESVAEGFDIIIHAGAGWHPNAARAFIRGQENRRNKTGAKVHYLHLSGTTSLSDYPLTENWIENRTFSDDDEIYSYLKAREAKKPYKVRETDIAIVEEGEARGVQTHNVMAPTIYGIGSGAFNQYSVQIPMMAQTALKNGHVSVIGKGEGVWSHVHVEDLALLFTTLVGHILDGQSLPSGHEGIYFCETGTHTLLEMAERLAKAAKKLGFLETDVVESVTLQQGADLWSGGTTYHAELAYGSNSRSKAVLGHKLGWKPVHGEEWSTTFADELTAMVAKPPRSFEVPSLMKKGSSGSK